MSDATLRLDGYNGAISQAIRALRYLAENDRPSEGEQFPNSDCCYLVAEELERTMRDIQPALVAWNDNRTNEGALRALAELTDCFLEKHGCFPLDNSRWKAAMTEAYRLVGNPHSDDRAQRVPAP